MSSSKTEAGASRLADPTCGNPPARILLVEDEEATRLGVKSFLESRGCSVDEAGTCRDAEELCRTAVPDAVVLDYTLPDGNALELLPKLRRVGPEVPVVILTAHRSIDLAVRAIQAGADQFLTKPVELETLCVVVQRLIENHRTRRRQLAERSHRSPHRLDPFRGGSAAILRLERQARKVLASDSPVLIIGETGAGKGVLASWLHHHGPRSENAFVDVNCAGLKRDFLESELFGHEKGAFTGAAANKTGLLEIAHRGSVFLDEIGDMDPVVQGKVLKVLDENRFRRLGDVRDRQVDLRLIAATHHDLAKLVDQGRFRRDLYYRINAIPLQVPSLGERQEDIPVLAGDLLAKVAADLRRPGLKLLPDAEAALMNHPWPGNIRELRNVLERAALHSESDALGARDMSFDSPGESYATELTLEEVERRHIARVLDTENGNVARAAGKLGISRASLYQRVKRYGLSRSG